MCQFFRIGITSADVSFCWRDLPTIYIDIYIYILTEGNVLLNHVQLNQIWIVITIFRLIWHQTVFRLVPNQSLQSVITIQIWFNLT